MTNLGSARRQTVRVLVASAAFGWIALLHATDVVDPGKERKKADIDCSGHKGSVVGRDGVHYKEGETDYPNGVSLSYTGTNCPDCCWVQFVWREILVQKKGGQPEPKKATIRTTGGSYDLTTDPKKPNYHPDSGSRRDPCYGAAFSSKTDKDSTTMFDRPGSAISSITRDETADDKTDNIESKVHFDAYLVCKGAVCAKVSWTVTYKWTKADGEKGPTVDMGDVDKSGDKPNADQMKALNDNYPGQTTVK
jgi:hypothetical protein